MRTLNRSLLALLLASGALASAQDILLNHLGFAPNAPKQAVVVAPKGQTPRFRVKDAAGKVVLEGKGEPSVGVDRWHRGPFSRLDLQGLQAPGTYRLEVEEGQGWRSSQTFEVRPELLTATCLPDILHWFKSQRSSGVYDLADRAIPYTGDRKGTRDVRGGWYDASGDVSKYLSHLGYANYMTPQHTPFAVWSLLETSERAQASTHERVKGQSPRALEEAFYGADFLMRMQDEAGYFYQSVFDVWSHDPAKRTLCAYKTQEGHKTDAYQAAWREGGGMAIAALARISRRTEALGEYTAAQYLATAEKGFAHLEAHGDRYADDGKQNLIDDYCALMAATELHRATGKAVYLDAARRRVASMASRQVKDGPFPGHFRVNDAGRPYFHAAEAGLPLVALLRYRLVEPEEARKASALDLVRKSLQAELKVTAAAPNPFGLARQVVQDLGGTPRDAFFFPHKNESGYWWQGENARLASLAAAARMAAPLLTDLAPALKAHAQAQVDWILGANPYDMCMLQGRGRNNPDYEESPNAPGGVCNGITSGFFDEHDLAFQPGKEGRDPNHSWRWAEQWLLHPSWLMLALSCD